MTNTWTEGDIVGGGLEFPLGDRAYYRRDDAGVWTCFIPESNQPPWSDEHIDDYIWGGLLVTYFQKVQP